MKKKFNKSKRKLGIMVAKFNCKRGLHTWDLEYSRNGKPYKRGCAHCSKFQQRRNGQWVD